MNIKLIKTGKFTIMPLSAQALYFHLSANVDRNNVADSLPIMERIGASHDDLKILVDNNFIKMVRVGIVNDNSEVIEMLDDRQFVEIIQYYIVDK